MKTDGVVEIGQKAAWIGHEVNCRALMRNDAIAVNVKFVLLGFAAENGMVFKDQTFRTGPCLAKKERGSRESADSAADYYAVVEFTSVSRVFQECGGICVPQVLPLLSAYSPTPPYPFQSSMEPGSAACGSVARSCAGENGLRSCAPEASRVAPRKSRRVIDASMPNDLSLRLFARALIGFGYCLVSRGWWLFS